MRPTAAGLFGPAGTPRVVVVGAGFGGIAAGVKLQQAGIDTFTINESSTGIGGTWWDNTYPGPEVDVGSHLSWFSFKPHDWTRTHANPNCSAISRRRPSTSTDSDRTSPSASQWTPRPGTTTARSGRFDSPTAPSTKAFAGLRIPEDAIADLGRQVRYLRHWGSFRR